MISTGAEKAPMLDCTNIPVGKDASCSDYLPSEYVGYKFCCTNGEDFVFCGGTRVIVIERCALGKCEQDESGQASWRC